MIKLSGFADEVSINFKEQIAFLNSAGLKYIELRFLDGENILNISQPKLAEAKQRLDDNGIGVSAIGSPIGKYGIDQPFEPHLDKFKRAAEIASFLGTGMIRVFSYYAPQNERIEDYREQVMERLRTQAEWLKGSGIAMVHENESHIYGHSAENCVDIARTIDSPHLSLAYDPANFVWGGGITDNVERCWPLMRPYTHHIHIKDWKLGSTDIGSLPGEGDGQIGPLIRELAGMNYTGFISIEPHMSSGGQFGGETTPQQFLAALANTKAFCTQYGLACA